jgi:hypothetical protein
MKTLIVVDVQPTYEDNVSFNVESLIEHMREYEKVIIFFNGADIGLDNLAAVREYFYSHGMTEDELERAIWCEKSYGFLRGWMDTGVDPNDIVMTLRLLIEKGEYDSRELDEEFFEKHDLPTDECLFLPFFEDQEKHIAVESAVSSSEVDICGGGQNECLLEMELYFEGLGVDTNRVQQFVY